MAETAVPTHRKAVHKDPTPPLKQSKSTSFLQSPKGDLSDTQFRGQFLFSHLANEPTIARRMGLSVRPSVCLYVQRTRKNETR